MFLFKGYDEIKNAIQRITHGRGKTTNTGDALEYTRNVMFSARAGGRGNVSRIAVVVTDGRSQKTIFTQEAAKQLQRDGVTLFAISIGFRYVPYNNNKIIFNKLSLELHVPFLNVQALSLAQSKVLLAGDQVFFLGDLRSK